MAQMRAYTIPVKNWIHICLTIVFCRLEQVQPDVIHPWSPIHPRSLTLDHQFRIIILDHSYLHLWFSDVRYSLLSQSLLKWTILIGLYQTIFLASILKMGQQEFVPGTISTWLSLPALAFGNGEHVMLLRLLQTLPWILRLSSDADLWIFQNSKQNIQSSVPLIYRKSKKYVIL